jgi:microcystin-dependent protein
MSRRENFFDPVNNEKQIFNHFSIKENFMDAFIGAIFSFGFNFAPVEFALCNGQLMSISGNEALFSLIGTTYGGDGVTTFGLPNMQGRVPIGTGQGPGLPNYVLGQAAGSETVTLVSSNLPSHTHPVLSANVPVSSAGANTNDPTGHYFATLNPSAVQTYADTSTVNMAVASGTTSTAGTGIPISILSPFLVISYCICLYGIYPSRN